MYFESDTVKSDCPFQIKKKKNPVNKVIKNSGLNKKVLTIMLLMILKLVAELFVAPAFSMCGILRLAMSYLGYFDIRM